MRPLKPNSRGAFVPTKSTIRTTYPEAPFSRPSGALRKLDRLRSGEVPKILIIRSRGGIGDVLMTTPTVKAISHKYNCPIDYCTDFGYLDGALPKVLKGISYIREVFDVKDLNARQEDYDAVINLTCPCTVHEKPLAKPINRIDLFARHADITLTDHRMDYVLEDQEIAWAKDYLGKNGVLQYKLVFVQPSSSHTQRDAPFPKMIDAMNRVAKANSNVRFLIVTHESDNVKISWDLLHSMTVNNLDVRQLSALMHHSDLVLCPDSAILHMASAQSKPTVTLFGPTDPRARVNYHPEAIAVWPAKNLKNYPIWYEKSTDGYMCWKLLEPEIISNVMHALLNKLPLPAYSDLVTYGSYRRDSFNYEIL